MAEVHKERLAAEIEGEFVVFLIGARFNRPWKLFRNFWFLKSMPSMLKELERRPEMGMLGYRQNFGLRGVTVTQYWRSYEQLEAYSRSKDANHFPAWVKFNKRIGSNGDIGIWHETYRIGPGQYEAIYNNMPAYGLGKAGKLVSAAGYRNTARGRMTGEENASPGDADDPVVSPA